MIRKREEKKVCEAEMSLIRSDMAAEEERVVRKDWGMGREMEGCEFLFLRGVLDFDLWFEECVQRTCMLRQ